MNTNDQKTSAKLILEDGSSYEAESFGHNVSVAGEIVFTTGMTGYPEAMTDPSYAGQILVFTYPLIGNYGVPEKKYWESDRVHTTAIVVSNYVDDRSHHQSEQSLSDWLKKEKVPGIIIKDTRAITQKIRDKGAMLGKIEFDDQIDFYDPNNDNLSDNVSVKQPTTFSPDKTKYKTILIDCGVKKNIIRSLVNRGVETTVVPWDFDIFSMSEKPESVVISNGPGDPKLLKETIENVSKLFETHIPILGICLGNQIMTLAAGGDTKKMKLGHRSQNQPCECTVQDGKYYLTTQNHGFVVSQIPRGFKPWFINANDGTNEGIIHTNKPWMSVQFHPEACPGPTDTRWVFDEFINHIT